MEFLTKFPVMERQALMEFRKSVDFAFRDFSRAYGDGIEAFFDPLLYFLVWLEKLFINSPLWEKKHEKKESIIVEIFLN